jgi:hypothetical protein
MTRMRDGLLLGTSGDVNGQAAAHGVLQRVRFVQYTRATIGDAGCVDAMRSRGAVTSAPMGGELVVQDTLEFRHVSVSINRSWNDVYDFISNGDYFEQWASGLGEKFRRAGDDWVAQGPLGTVTVRVVQRNGLGVADHDVVLENGVTVHNPIRVIPNGTGSTVTFTLFRMAGVSEQKFNDDAKAVEKDLLSLKAVLEKP